MAGVYWLFETPYPFMQTVLDLLKAAGGKWVKATDIAPHIDGKTRTVWRIASELIGVEIPVEKLQPIHNCHDTYLYRYIEEVD